MPPVVQWETRQVLLVVCLFNVHSIGLNDIPFQLETTHHSNGEQFALSILSIFGEQSKRESSNVIEQGMSTSAWSLAGLTARP